jgi:capsular exopolysaccharide synthesis family protein
VVLVDADLRRPTVARTFNLVQGAGLTDVLAGRSTIAEVLQPWGVSGKLLILAAGKTPPNPSELLGSERMHTLLQELSQQAIVLVDAPPLIPVTDAAILTHNTDGALVVASVGKTTIEALTKALQNLQRANGRALGVILNRVPRRGIGSGYGYYGYNYTAAPTNDLEPTRGGPPETNPGQDTSVIKNDVHGDAAEAVTFDQILAGSGFTVEDEEGESDVLPLEPARSQIKTRRELRNRSIE